MNPDILLLVSVWDTIKHYIPKKDRIEAAEHLVRVFDEEVDMGNLQEEMDTFDTALKTAVARQYGVDEYDEEEDEWN